MIFIIILWILPTHIQAFKTATFKFTKKQTCKSRAEVRISYWSRLTVFLVNIEKKMELRKDLHCPPVEYKAISKRNTSNLLLINTHMGL